MHMLCFALHSCKHIQHCERPGISSALLGLLALPKRLEPAAAMWVRLRLAEGESCPPADMHKEKMYTLMGTVHHRPLCVTNILT